MQPEVRVRKFRPLREHRGLEKAAKFSHATQRAFKQEHFGTSPAVLSIHYPVFHKEFLR